MASIDTKPASAWTDQPNAWTRSWPTSSTGPSATMAQPARTTLRHRGRANASPPAMTVGSMIPPAATNSGSRPTAPTPRTASNAQPGASRRRATATIDCVRPNTVNPRTMNNVPFQVNSGVSEISRIHPRASAPSARPPNTPAARVGMAGGRNVRASSVTVVVGSSVMAAPRRGGRTSTPTDVAGSAAG